MEITPNTIVYDTPSNLGGTFTVTILERNDDAGTARVRVCYGRFREDGSYVPWPDWDGYTFVTGLDQLTNERRYRDQTPKPNQRTAEPNLHLR